MSALRTRIGKLVSTVYGKSPTSPPITPKRNVPKPQKTRRKLSVCGHAEIHSPCVTPNKSLHKELLKIGSPLIGLSHLGLALLRPSSTTTKDCSPKKNVRATATPCKSTENDANDYDDVLGTEDISDSNNYEHVRRRFTFSDAMDSGTESMRCYSESHESELPSGPTSRHSSVLSSISTPGDESSEVGVAPNPEESNADVDLDTPTRKLVLVNGIEALSTKPTVVGKGGFGIVIKAQHKGDRVAAKIISKNKRRRRSIEYSLKGELIAMALDHSSIVKTLGIFGIDDDHTLVIMEYAGQYNLLNILNNNVERISLSRRLWFSIQLANALQFCHQKNIAHLDVKPANIIVGPNDVCKLADFGCSQHVDVLQAPYQSTWPLDGTVAYKAPELLRGNSPTVKADVYSYGVTLWHILLREQPFSGVDPHVIVYKVVSSNTRPSPTTTEDGCNYEYVRLYQACWEGNLELRPTMDDAWHRLIAIAKAP